jgi:hypothetical protein
MMTKSELDPSWATKNHSHHSTTNFSCFHWMVTESNRHQTMVIKNLLIVRPLWQLKNLLVSKPLYMATKKLSVNTPLWRPKPCGNQKPFDHHALMVTKNLLVAIILSPPPHPSAPLHFFSPLSPLMVTKTLSIAMLCDHVL